MQAGNNHDTHPTANRDAALPATRTALLQAEKWWNSRQSANRAGL